MACKRTREKVNLIINHANIELDIHTSGHDCVPPKEEWLKPGPGLADEYIKETEEAYAKWREEFNATAKQLRQDIVDAIGIREELLFGRSEEKI